MDLDLVNLLKIMILTSLFSFLFIEVLTPLAQWVGLVDRPDKARKNHVGDVPLAGGIAVFSSSVLSILIWLGPSALDFEFFFLASCLVVFVGILDDKYDLSVRARLVGQVLISLLIVIGAKTSLLRFGDILGIGSIDISGASSFLVTVCAVLALINAFNMLDGMDGLLGSVSIVPLLALGFLFSNAGMSELAVMTFAISSAIVPFLMYNIGIPKDKFTKIFLGDAGSMFLGLSVVYFLLRGSQELEVAFRPVTALWIVGVPLMDLVVVMSRRIYKGLSVFDADKQHLHHMLLNAGFGRKQILLVVMTVSLSFAILGIWGEMTGVAEYLMFSFFLASFAVYFYVVHGRYKRKKVLALLGGLMNMTPKLAR